MCSPIGDQFSGVQWLVPACQPHVKCLLPPVLHNDQHTVQVDGDLEATSRFVDAVKIPYIAPSLGGCETLIEQPTVISYWDQGPAKRAELGIKDNLIRFSCGLEGIENIYSDIDLALSHI